MESHNSWMNKNMLGNGTICNISSTLVCIALACVAIIVIIATLRELGIFSSSKRIYNETK